MAGPSNEQISHLLTEIADRLFHQKANPYRIAAYRNASKMVEQLKYDLADIADQEHIETLIAVPTIGKSIANVIIEYVNAGSSQFLKRIKGDHYNDSIFDEIPGIGPHLSHLVTSRLKIRTMGELRDAVEDGRLDRLPGFGPKRMRLIKMALAAESSIRQREKGKIIDINSKEQFQHRPNITVLIRLDYLYRNKAERGELHKLKPKNNNPNQKTWLPIYHKELHDWHFTCLYSNTVRAHELGKSKDWVIIYYEKDGREGQCTIVTEITGRLQDQRVVRGREDECYTYYKKRLVDEF